MSERERERERRRGSVCVCKRGKESLYECECLRERICVCAELFYIKMKKRKTFGEKTDKLEKSCCRDNKS